MANKEVIDRKWKELAREHGISEPLLYNRIRGRWKPELAATTPKGVIPPDRFLPKPERGPSPHPVTITQWTPEQIEAHLAEIGPDKGFEMHANRGKQTAVTAPQQRKEQNRRYYKKGGEW